MPAGAIHRLFFTVLPDAPTRERLADIADRLRPDYPARWVRPSRYHLTLCFLGLPGGCDEPAMAGCSGAGKSAQSEAHPSGRPIPCVSPP